MASVGALRPDGLRRRLTWALGFNRTPRIAILLSDHQQGHMTPINPQDYYASVSAGNAGQALYETIKLHDTIKQQIEASNKQSDVIDKITKFMAVLAVIQTIATVVQVWPLINPKDSSPTEGNAAENRSPKQNNLSASESQVNINPAASATSQPTKIKSNKTQEKPIPSSK